MQFSDWDRCMSRHAEVPELIGRPDTAEGEGFEPPRDLDGP
jgi:hypothetical protein